jgi:hypothetical protein
MLTRILTRVLLVGALASMAACVPSLNPFFTTGDLVLEPALLGSWSGEGSDETWTISQGDGSMYRIVHTVGDGKEGVFNAGLMKIQDHLVFDISPAEPECVKNDLQRAFLLPMHMIGWVRQVEPELKVAVLGPDWMEKHLKANPDALPHAAATDMVMLTAPTDALQAFVATLFDNPDAWGELEPMTKKTAAE